MMTGAHLHGVGAFPGPAPALKAYDAMFAHHGDANPDPRDPQPADETSAVECASTDLLTWGLQLLTTSFLELLTRI